MIRLARPVFSSPMIISLSPFIHMACGRFISPTGKPPVSVQNVNSVVNTICNVNVSDRISISSDSNGRRVLSGNE